MPMISVTPESIKAKIESHIVGANAVVADLTGSGDHFSVDVVSKTFEGLTQLKRHRLIYDALADEMKHAIHALRIIASVH